MSPSSPLPLGDRTDPTPDRASQKPKRRGQREDAAGRKKTALESDEEMEEEAEADADAAAFLAHKGAKGAWPPSAAASPGPSVPQRFAWMDRTHNSGGTPHSNPPHSPYSTSRTLLYQKDATETNLGCMLWTRAVQSNCGLAIFHPALGRGCGEI